MKVKTVLIISYSLLHRDPRILRQVQALEQNYKITTIGYTPIKNDSIIHYPLNIPIKSSLIRKFCNFINVLLRRFKNNTEKILEARFNLKNILSMDIATPDVIFANDWNGLYLASALKSKHNWKVKIYYDAHEYSPKDHNSIRWWLVIRPLVIDVLKKCKSDISAMTTVCDGIARAYEKFYCFPKGFVRVVTNATEYNANLTPRVARERVIKLIHHGGAIKKRRLELMIEMMRYLDPDKYELTFMLVKTEPRYYKSMVKIAEKYKNIKFIEPVSFSEITSTLNNYDIGVYILLPQNFNHQHALPNKLFEFVQARLAIAIAPSVEMVKIVKQYDLGVCAKDFTPKSLANSIAEITPNKLLEYKKNADKHARELSAEANITQIRNIVTELT